MKRKFLIMLGFTAVIISGCYYDKEDLLYGGTCDTSTTTYSATITGILNNYGCMNCHVGGNPSGGINLESYANVKAYVDNGKLYGSISHASGFIPMPDGAAKMSSCDLKKVKAWIDAGAPNN
jgi:hypothetical protein